MPIASLALRDRDSASFQVASGQIWHFVTPDSIVNLEDEFQTRWCPGRIDDQGWRPLGDEPLGPYAGKLVFQDEPEPTVVVDYMRKGMLLGDPHTPPEQKPRPSRAASLLHHGRAVIIPGTRSATNLRAELLLSFHKRFNWPQPGAFQIWRAWGISTSPGVELLSCFSELRACKIVGDSRTGNNITELAAKLLAEALGLLHPAGPWERGRYSLPNRSVRGEMVKVRFREDHAPVPCLVVSPNSYNNQTLDVLMVLQCIPYLPHHERAATVIPLGDGGLFPGIEGGWSASLHSIRGITDASHSIEQYSPRARLNEVDPGRFERLHKRLEFFYA
jgi:hypothetical protein